MVVIVVAAMVEGTIVVVVGVVVEALVLVVARVMENKNIRKGSRNNSSSRGSAMRIINIRRINGNVSSRKSKDKYRPTAKAILLLTLTFDINYGTQNFIKENGNHRHFHPSCHCFLSFSQTHGSQ